MIIIFRHHKKSSCQKIMYLKIRHHKSWCIKSRFHDQNFYRLLSRDDCRFAMIISWSDFFLHVFWMHEHPIFFGLFSRPMSEIDDVKICHSIKKDRPSFLNLTIAKLQVPFRQGMSEFLPTVDPVLDVQDRPSRKMSSTNSFPNHRHQHIYIHIYTASKQIKAMIETGRVGLQSLVKPYSMTFNRQADFQL